MNDSMPEFSFDPGLCIFTSQAFEALLEHRVPPGLVVDAHVALLPGAMSVVQLQQRLMAVLSGTHVVSHFRLKSELFGPADADLVVTTNADRQTTLVQLVEEVDTNRNN